MIPWPDYPSVHLHVTYINADLTKPCEPGHGNCFACVCGKGSFCHHGEQHRECAKQLKVTKDEPAIPEDLT